jgi:hypothetical protein
MPIPIRTVTRTRTDKTTRIELDANALHRLLAAAGHDVPQDALIYFRVPGGADWSNTDIDIDGQHPVHICWTETTTSD